MGLIITRKVGEELTITNDNTGEVIIIQPTTINDGQVRLNISAPQDYFILRSEIDPKMPGGSI